MNLAVSPSYDIPIFERCQQRTIILLERSSLLESFAMSIPRTVSAVLALSLFLGLGSADAAPQTRPIPGKPGTTQPTKPTQPPAKKPTAPEKKKTVPTDPAKPGEKTTPPRRLPEHSRLQNELSATQQQLQPLTARVQRALSATTAARNKIRQAVTIIRRVGQIDDTLARIIRQLTPLAKLPPTRSVDPLVDALTAVKKQIHRVRVKADAIHKSVLTPADQKLKPIETGLTATVDKLKDGIARINQTKAHADTLRELVASRGDKSADVRTLESLSSTTRAALPPVRSSVKALDESSAAIEREINQFTSTMTALTNFSPMIETLWDGVEPINKAARDLDKTLNERIEIDVLGAKTGFTVRQILEGPGNVADAVLKPLEKLAEDAIRPVLKALKLEIQPPKELTALLAAFDSLTVPDFPAFAKLEAAMSNKSVAEMQVSLNTFLAKKAIP